MTQICRPSASCHPCPLGKFNSRLRCDRCVQASHGQMASGLREQFGAEVAGLQESLLQARRANAALQVWAVLTNASIARQGVVMHFIPCTRLTAQSSKLPVAVRVWV